MAFQHPLAKKNPAAAKAGEIAGRIKVLEDEIAALRAGAPKTTLEDYALTGWDGAAPFPHPSHPPDDEENDDDGEDQRQRTAAHDELGDQRKAPTRFEVDRVRFEARVVHLSGRKEGRQQVPGCFALEKVKVAGMRKLGKHDLFAILQHGQQLVARVLRRRRDIQRSAEHQRFDR